MGPNATEPNRGWWVVAGLAALVVLVALWLWLGFSTEAVRLRDDAATTAGSQLATLLVLALFVERLLEVFISVWREERRRELAEDAAAGGAADAREELVQHQSGTQRAALLGGLIIGVLIALAGVRVMGAMIEAFPPGAPVAQKLLFHTVDVLITGGLIGGGAEALHKLMSLLTDYLDKTRKAVENAAPREGGGGG